MICNILHPIFGECWQFHQVVSPTEVGQYLGLHDADRTNTLLKHPGPDRIKITIPLWSNMAKNDKTDRNRSSMFQHEIIPPTSRTLNPLMDCKKTPFLEVQEHLKRGTCLYTIRRVGHVLQRLGTLLVWFLVQLPWGGKNPPTLGWKKR